MKLYSGASAVRLNSCGEVLRFPSYISAVELFLQLSNWYLGLQSLFMCKIITFVDKPVFGISPVFTLNVHFDIF